MCIQDVFHAMMFHLAEIYKSLYFCYSCVQLSITIYLTPITFLYLQVNHIRHNMKNKTTAMAVTLLLYLLVLKTISLGWGTGISDAIFMFHFYKQNCL